jgi:hypothetical protein
VHFSDDFKIGRWLRHAEVHSPPSLQKSRRHPYPTASRHGKR